MKMNRESSEVPDCELVAEARQGGDGALEELLRRHYGSCVKYATWILGDRAGAEDVTQQACLNVFKHLHQYQGDAAFLSWIKRIVLNQCLMASRSRQRARFCYIDADPAEHRGVPIRLRAHGGNPEQILIEKEMRDVMQRELRRIPKLYRDILVLYHLQELPLTCVANSLGITIAATKSRLHRARLELRDRFRHHYPGAHAGAQLRRRAA